MVNEATREDVPERAQLPWTMPDKQKEDILKQQIMILSEEPWNFLEPPPDSKDLAGWQWKFDADVAMLCLQQDAKLAELRFRLVPGRISEERFWHNFFARAFLLRRSIEAVEIRGEDGSSVVSDPVQDDIDQQISASLLNLTVPLCEDEKSLEEELDQIFPD
eukprot:TRINITY_DN2061_c0_g2_i2.p1 TRINITY_DN2061_c0_g2~~TRINITY_DN2061_c0_g2_i2.p1  ORF type:complete len:187 (+),score=39.77 TRINITY_DN2061_c0_g2_i2:78-563(+)